MALAPSDTPCFPWPLPEALQQLATDGGAALVIEILDLFVSDTCRRLRSLREALERGDPVRLKAQAHAVKGSAIQVGADSLAALCLELELNAGPDLLVQEVEVEFERLCALHLG
ncbi:MAG TPA: Hpt domain-containing protein [Candidatus Sulfopaludibacter sp.]|jgi:HPt (histidine-containing phosphotransfer) domain-containing protein|nr:Hpt domain-containing protein [Candidatus Sulfopaludibacter sp.]